MDEPDSTANAVKKSISTFFGQVTEALIPSIEDEDIEAILITNDGSITLTGFHKHLAELQSNEETYLIEPANELQGKYKRWLEVVEQDQFTEPRLAKHLSSSVILNEKYINLVPDKISHMEFWKRYLFKRALLEDALANAEIAEKRSKAEVNSTNSVVPNKTIIQTTQPKKIVSDDELKELKKKIIEDILYDDDELVKYDDLKWVEEDDYIEDHFFHTHIELPEEEQERILAEYEKEIQEREKRKTEENVNSSNIKKKQSPNQKKNQQQQQKQSSNSNKKGTAKSDKKNPNEENKTNKQNLNKKTQQNNQKGNQTNKTNRDRKLDDSGNSLKVEKNHFKMDDKEDIASSNSDESWDKLLFDSED